MGQMCHKITPELSARGIQLPAIERAQAALESARATLVRCILHFVPYQMPCPKCAKVGFIRMERVITGSLATKAYFCGSCEHGWQVSDRPVEPPLDPNQRRKPQAFTYGPRKRRSDR